MEVTKQNFKEVLPQVEHAVKNAAFMSVDLEFSGLQLPGEGINALDTLVERYQKNRRGCTQYTVFQVGLCCFEHNTAENRYVQKAFNFYIFPRQFGRAGPDKRFLCQGSSIEFLSKQGFDFNKVFRDGISYLTPDEEYRLKEMLQQKHNDIAMKEAMQASPHHFSPSFRSPIQIPERNQEFINKIIGQLEEFKGSDKEELPLDPCNGFLRKLIYQTLEHKYKNEFHAGTQTTDGICRLVITKVSGENELKEKEEAKKQAEFQEIDDAVGFAKVIRIISQSGKLVVGHNMILDLLHTLAHFVGPLPETYSEFKLMAMGVFPRICDTKLMADTQPFKDHFPNHSLNALQKSLEISPFSMPDVDAAEGFPSYSTNTEHYHEAGFDAYITGLCFISMMNYLGSVGKSESSITVKSPLLQPFFNKLYLMRLYDIPYMNLEGDDLTPCRDHVFHVQFSPEWKTADIAHLFMPFGGIQITWIDDQSAFASLYRREEAAQVFKQIPKLGHNYKVTSYKEYLDRTTRPSSPANANPELKRKIPTSDVDLPTNTKRRRSHSSEKSSPYMGDRAITPIMEEDEEENGEKDGNKGNKMSKLEVPSAIEETPKHGGTPKKRALFEEPQDW